MKISLIIPPSGFHVDERVFPTLGILKVAAVLEKAGHDVVVLDLSGEQNIEAAIVKHVVTVRAELYGITATMPQMPSAITIVRALKGHNTDSPRLTRAKVILGGPHPTLLYASAKAEKKTFKPGRAKRAMMELMLEFDHIVCGDGEKAIFEVLKDGAPTIIDADDIKSELFLTNKALDEAPLPARHLIDIGSYHFQIEGIPTMSMIAQLGCPFGCAFCGGRNSPFLRKVRTRSTSSVVNEMVHLYTTYGTKAFMFLDDELNVNKQFMELLEQMTWAQQKLGTRWRMRGLLKSELLTEPMARAMYGAGFRQILVGFESGHDRILVNIKKHATVAQNTRCIEIAREAGITVKACMSLGHAGESPETIETTMQWLLKVKPNEFDVTMLTVYPGTPYYDEAVQEGSHWTYTAPSTGDKLYADNVDHLTDVNFYKGRPEGYQAFVWTDHLTKTQLEKERDRVEKVVRSELQIAYPKSYAEVHLEHSMGLR